MGGIVGVCRAIRRGLFPGSTAAVLAIVVGGAPPARAAEVCYTGPYPFTNTSAISCIDASGAAFSGDIVNTNTGTISATEHNGITLSLSAISGQVSNTGTISASWFYNGIRADQTVISNGIVNNGNISAGTIGISGAVGIYVGNAPTFAGGIQNAGTISVLGGHGVQIQNISDFTGGVTNTGSISSDYLDGITAHVSTTFSGGISNSGMISVKGIGVSINTMTTFTGGIQNSGTMSADGGGIVAAFVTNFQGGISNTGAISTGFNSYGIAIGSMAEFAGGIANLGTISAGGDGIFVGAYSPFPISTFSGGIANSGTISAARTGIEVLHASSFSGGISNTGTITGLTGITVVSSGPVSLFNSGTITGTGGTAVDLSSNSAGNTFTLGPGFTITGAVKGKGSDALQLGGTGTGAFDLNNIGTQYTGFSAFNTVSGTWATTGTSNQNWTISGGTLQIGNGGTTGSIVGNITDNGVLAFNRSDTVTYAGNISGTGAVQQIGAGKLILTGNNTYTGVTTISASMLQIGNGGTSGSIAGTIANNGSLVFNRSDNVTFGGTISGSGNVQQSGSGTLALTGANSYTGPTSVNSGALEVGGSIASSSLTTVKSGAALKGTGTVGATLVNSGGTLAPGSAAAPGTLSVAGNLMFQPGAIFDVAVTPTTASKVNVGGPAQLAGTAQARFATGSFLTNQYGILHSSGLGGTTFSSFSTVDLPANFTASLNYTSTDVLLNLQANLSSPSTPSPSPGGPSASPSGPAKNLNDNQQSVAQSLDQFFNSGGTLPPNFVTVFAFSGDTLSDALSQLSGENATVAQIGAITSTKAFLNLLASHAGGGGPSASADAAPGPFHFMVAGDNAVPVEPKSFLRTGERWTAWGEGFGGYGKFGGAPRAGSHDSDSRFYGIAGGLEYRFDADVLLGGALAWTSSDWDLDRKLGSGSGEGVSAGFFGKAFFGRAYVSATVSFATHWIETERAALGNLLTGKFRTETYAGRLEAGYRFEPGITPYLAVQLLDVHMPRFAETDVTGGGFGLIYDANDTVNTRSEIGLSFDHRTAALADRQPIVLRAAVAWGHDWVNDSALGVGFRALPGSHFIVTGAQIPRNFALASLGTEFYLTDALSFSADFDGEFARNAQTYVGAGKLNYQW